MKTVIAASLTIVGAAALAACSALPQHEGGSGMPPPSADDQCRASEHQNLVGQNRTQIPQTPAGAAWRITCTSCAMTMDYRPDRLNILYDQQTGIVREVKCG